MAWVDVLDPSGEKNLPIIYDPQTSGGLLISFPIDEAKRFVEETNVDWLSVAIGNIHGAVSAARKSEKKIEARLDINRLDDIREAVGIPLVLHGGTGISKDYIIKSIQHGIAKVNVATAIRQPYEKAVQESLAAGQEAVYRRMLAIIREDLEIENSAARLA